MLSCKVSPMFNLKNLCIERWFHATDLYQCQSPVRHSFPLTNCQQHVHVLVLAIILLSDPALVLCTTFCISLCN